jgi:hypothetical protein
MNHSPRPTSVVTAGLLSAASGLHIAWGHGSSFPFRSVGELTDNVVGSPRAPAPNACYAVAALLGSLGVAVVVPPRHALHRQVLQLAAAAFAGRAVAGFAGRTDVLVPGSSSQLFRRRDRQIYAPLCALLSFGVWRSSRRSA